MPVDFADDEWALRLREGTNAYRILGFLGAHPDQGFTSKEISDATDVPRGSVGATLSRLGERDLVRHKEPYWAIGEDDRLAAYAGAVYGLGAAEDRFRGDEWGEVEETAVDPRTGDGGDDA